MIFFYAHSSKLGLFKARNVFEVSSPPSPISFQLKHIRFGHQILEYQQHMQRLKYVDPVISPGDPFRRMDPYYCSASPREEDQSTKAESHIM